MLRRASGLALVGLLEFLAADIYSVVTIDLANGHGNTGALVLVNYGNLVFTAICSVLPLAIVTSAFPVLSATEGDAFDRTSAGSNRAVVLMSLLSTAVMIAVALPAAHVLTQKPDQVAPLAESFLLFAPGVAGFAVVTNLSRVLFALGKLKVAGVGLVAQQLLPAALSFPMVLLAPPRLAVGALALASSIGQLAVAIPMVAATRRLRGSAVRRRARPRHLRRDRGGRRRGRRGPRRSRWSCPTGGAIFEALRGRRRDAARGRRLRGGGVRPGQAGRAGRGCTGCCGSLGTERKYSSGETLDNGGCVPARRGDPAGGRARPAHDRVADDSVVGCS